MTKEEFEKEAGTTVSNDDYYKIIEFVYMWHPSISEDPIQGRKDIVAVYHLRGGMTILQDMIVTARKVKDLKEELHRLCNQKKAIEEQEAVLLVKLSEFQPNNL